MGGGHRGQVGWAGEGDERGRDVEGFDNVNVMAANVSIIFSSFWERSDTDDVLMNS